VIDENDQGETADNNTLFSEIQLSGDVEASGSSETILDRNFRLSRLRRLTTVDRRISSSLSTKSDSIVDIEKVRKLFRGNFMSMFEKEISWNIR